MNAHGAIAQLGERCNRTAEVVSSNLIGSTKFPFQGWSPPNLTQTQAVPKSLIFNGF
jgi:hypothetical protein